MSYTMTINELENTARVRRLCVGNSDPVFISDEDGNEQMVLLDMNLYRTLYAKQKIYQMIAEAEQDIAEGRCCDAREAMAEIFGTVRV